MLLTFIRSVDRTNPNQMWALDELSNLKGYLLQYSDIAEDISFIPMTLLKFLMDRDGFTPEQIARNALFYLKNKLVTSEYVVNNPVVFNEVIKSISTDEDCQYARNMIMPVDIIIDLDELELTREPETEAWSPTPSSSDAWSQEPNQEPWDRESVGKIVNQPLNSSVSELTIDELEQEPSTAVELEQEPSTAVELEQEPSTAVELEQEPSTAVELEQEQSTAVKLEQEQSTAVKLEQEPLVQPKYFWGMF